MALQYQTPRTDYAEIFSRHSIAKCHQDAFLLLVVSNELDASSEFALKLDSDRSYQLAVEEALEKKFAPLRDAFAGKIAKK